MDREIPFEKDAKCDVCGKMGAFDFMGDYICEKCFADIPMDKRLVELDTHKKAMADTKRLDKLENCEGVALVNDDFGHWAVVENGMQNVPDETPADIQTTFFIEKREWKDTIREAIDAYLGGE